MDLLGHQTGSYFDFEWVRFSIPILQVRVQNPKPTGPCNTHNSTTDRKGQVDNYYQL